jgi:hypothetical protein
LPYVVSRFFLRRFSIAAVSLQGLFIMGGTENKSTFPPVKERSYRGSGSFQRPDDFIAAHSKGGVFMSCAALSMSNFFFLCFLKYTLNQQAASPQNRLF